MYLVLIPHCMTEIIVKECKSGKSTVLALGTVHGQVREYFIKPRPFPSYTEIYLHAGALLSTASTDIPG